MPKLRLAREDVSCCKAYPYWCEASGCGNKAVVRIMREDNHFSYGCPEHTGEEGPFHHTLGTEGQLAQSRETLTREDERRRTK